MAGSRPEPFRVALIHLRRVLQAGEFAPGTRLAAVELADDLRLSTTPVREALSRLAGEGVLEERRGQGYFVRLLSSTDIADLYRLSLAHLLIALEPRRPGLVPPAPRPTEPADAAWPEDPVRRVETLFSLWLASTGGRLLARSFRNVQVQLGPVRRLEPAVLGGLAAEADDLLAAHREDGPMARLVLLRRFHALRIREAPRLAAALEARAARAGDGSNTG